MTRDERADDPAALVATVRREHTPYCDYAIHDYSICEQCKTKWPCLTVRLAEALEAEQLDARKYRDLYSRALARNSEIYERNKAECEELLADVYASRADADGLRERTESLYDRLMHMAYREHRTQRHKRAALNDCESELCLQNAAALASPQ